MRAVPFFNYPGVYRERSSEYLSAIESVLQRGAFIMQEELFQFEAGLADYLGCKHAIGVADGTAALEMSLAAAGIKTGDEVIVSSHTFIATAAAVHHMGGIPVLADCQGDSMIDPESVRRQITGKTRILMPTQLNGRTCDMDALQAIAEEFNLKIVEDSCQALGAKYKNQFAGLFGVAGSYSFYPAKTLGCFGDGGAVVTNDDAAAELIRKLRDHGRDKDGNVRLFGRNGRLDNLQAAILNIKLKHYDEMVGRRREIAALYQANLSDLDQLVLPPAPGGEPERFDVFQNYEVMARNRDALRAFLSQQGIGTIIQWGGKMVHQFKDLGLRHDALFAEKMSQGYMLLPMHHLLEDEDVEYVCEKIRLFYGIE